MQHVPPPSDTKRSRRTSLSRLQHVTLRGSVPPMTDLIGGSEKTHAMTWHAIGRILDLSCYANKPLLTERTCQSGVERDRKRSGQCLSAGTIFTRFVYFGKYISVSLFLWNENVEAWHQEVFWESLRIRESHSGADERRRCSRYRVSGCSPKNYLLPIYAHLVGSEITALINPM